MQPNRSSIQDGKCAVTIDFLSQHGHCGVEGTSPRNGLKAQEVFCSPFRFCEQRINRIFFKWCKRNVSALQTRSKWLSLSIQNWKFHPQSVQIQKIYLRVRLQLDCWSLKSVNWLYKIFAVQKVPSLRRYWPRSECTLQEMTCFSLWKSGRFLDWELWCLHHSRTQKGSVPISPGLFVTMAVPSPSTTGVWVELRWHCLLSSYHDEATWGRFPKINTGDFTTRNFDTFL